MVGVVPLASVRDSPKHFFLFPSFQGQNVPGNSVRGRGEEFFPFIPWTYCFCILAFGDVGRNSFPFIP